MALPVEWVRRLKATGGLSHRVIRLDWSPDSPSLTVSALTIEELQRESVREEGSHTVTDSVIEGDGAQVVAETQVS